jgi:tetratricopeptide (TPR) repeat protein
LAVGNSHPTWRQNSSSQVGAPETAEREMSKGRLQASIQHLQKAIHIAPEHMEAHNNLGTRYMEMSDYERAAVQFQTALRLDQSAILPHINLSLARYFMKRCAEAEQAARETVRQSPSLAKAHYLLALILAEEDKDTTEALEHLQKSVVEFPNARLVAARLLVRQGNENHAAVVLREYLASPEAKNRGQVESWLAGLSQ